MSWEVILCGANEYANSNAASLVSLTTVNGLTGLATAAVTIYAAEPYDTNEGETETGAGDTLIEIIKQRGTLNLAVTGFNFNTEADWDAYRTLTAILNKKYKYIYNSTYPSRTDFFIDGNAVDVVVTEYETQKSEPYLDLTIKLAKRKLNA